MDCWPDDVRRDKTLQTSNVGLWPQDDYDEDDEECEHWDSTPLHFKWLQEWNADKNWSSQEWKSDELVDGRTGRPVLFAQHTDRFIVENDNMDSYTESESEMSLKPRSFLHKVNDQVRKRQYQSSKDATKDSDKHSVIRRMFMSSTLQASVFMEKNYSDNCHSIKNTKHLAMKQMFDISAKLVSEQDEIYGVKQLIGNIIHGSICL